MRLNFPPNEKPPPAIGGERTPVVYFDFVQFPELHGETPKIKIGESGNHIKRRKDFNKSKFGIKFDVQHLCMVRGTRADEQQILRYFSKYLLPNEEETFFINDELVDYIRWLRNQYFVWVPDCEQCLPVDRLEFVESSLWMPSQDRRVSTPPQKNLFQDFGQLNLPPREITIDDFYTNGAIIEAARACMGSIDLDPASHPVANGIVKAAKFFSIHDDGTIKPWAGRVWLNPPFSQWAVWVPKVISEWSSGRIEAMCILCQTRTITAQYFAPIKNSCSAIVIFHGRIGFWGGRAGDANDGHMVFYFGNDVQRFREAFCGIGNVYIPAISLELAKFT